MPGEQSTQRTINVLQNQNRRGYAIKKIRNNNNNPTRRL